MTFHEARAARRRLVSGNKSRRGGLKMTLIIDRPKIVLHKYTYPRLCSSNSVLPRTTTPEAGQQQRAVVYTMLKQKKRRENLLEFSQPVCWAGWL
ncbi:hypothetical protein CEXT_597291 [Caerostris extrusa]|uniref:Uncharacterized protein n=1 Tax=Caerostris extrusa TaxID=172846 RepID=A0AAV4Q9E2_CAEEX|nr:hypothetical protein CEXT_597291 [Caerostris extrusa]